MSRDYHVSAALTAALFLGACGTEAPYADNVALGPTLELAASGAGNPTTAIDRTTDS